ncbi:MAG: hypothetical protein WAZ27_00995, partial [Minisyncoccia bacterium]
MRDIDTTFKYVGLAAIALLVFGLAGWYVFIGRQTADVGDLSESRGFNVGVPSFTGSRGSTAENIALGFGASLIEAGVASSSGERPRPPRMWRVSSSPVAGAGFVQSGDANTLRFVERSTGHVFDADPRTGTVARRTNRLIPKVYDAAVGPGGAIVARSFSDEGVRATFVGSLGTTTVDGFTPLEGVDLGPQITDIAFTSSSSILFLTREKGGTQLIRSGLDGSKSTQVVSLFAGEFDMNLLPDGRVTLTEKPASGIAGNAYEVGKDGSLIALTRNTSGLTLLARASSSALFVGTDAENRLALSVRPSREAALTTLNLATIADKCAWVPGISLTAFCAVPQV